MRGKLYVDAGSALRVEVELPQAFLGKRGVAQGCLLSTFLYTVFVEPLHEDTFSALPCSGGHATTLLRQVGAILLPGRRPHHGGAPLPLPLHPFPAPRHVRLHLVLFPACGHFLPSLSRTVHSLPMKTPSGLALVSCIAAWWATCAPIPCAP
jgi:hypothetical protein